MRALLLLLLLPLAGCNIDVARVNESDGAREAARGALRACSKVCPAGATPIALSTLRETSVFWTCGCLGAQGVLP